MIFIILFYLVCSDNLHWHKLIFYQHEVEISTFIKREAEKFVIFDGQPFNSHFPIKLISALMLCKLFL